MKLHMNIAMLYPTLYTYIIFSISNQRYYRSFNVHGVGQNSNPNILLVKALGRSILG
jgi:hypothetical protein